MEGVGKVKLFQFGFLLLWIGLSISHSNLYAQEQPPSVSAELSQANVVFGDPVSLTITARNTNARPDLSSLHALFNITGRSVSQQESFVNGVNNFVVNWVIQIEPKQSGVLTVPPLKLGNLQTPPLALNVGDPATGADRVLFIEASVDNENPYIQSQVLLTVKIWQSIDVLGREFANLGSDQYQTFALERDKEYLDTRDGKEYLVQETQYALFPQAIGVHTVGPIELRAQIPADSTQVQGFLSPRRIVKRFSQPIVVNVQPRPDSVQGQWWLPAKNVEISDSWSADPKNINANDTITRTIEIQATGVIGDQLPDIEPPSVEGLKFYADNVDRSSVVTDQGIVSTQRITWAVIPERDGEINVPAFTLNWFNTESEQPEATELPAQTVVVSGLDERPASLVTADSQNNGNLANNDSLVGPVSTSLPFVSGYPNWLWLLLGAVGILFIQAIGVGLWKLRSLHSSAKSNVQQNAIDAAQIPSLQKVSSAAKSAKLNDLQQAVLQWAQEFWPQTPPNNLLSVAQRLNEPKLGEIFTDIDTALYGTSEESVYLLEIEKLMRASARQIVDGGKAIQPVSRLPKL